MAGSLANISKARQALSQAKSLEDVLQIRDQAKAVETYCRAARETLELQNQAAEIKVRAERKAGELIAKMDKRRSNQYRKKMQGSTMEPCTKGAKLQEIGVSKSQAFRLESMAAVPEEVFEQIADATKATEEGREITSSQVQKIGRQVKKGGVHVANNSGESEWYTPKKYIVAAREVLEEIELDPASSKVAQKTVFASKFYTKQDDGLSKEWRGNVWMNPPYGKKIIEQFISKLCSSFETGQVPEAIVLVNNATETEWFHAIASYASGICFPKGRIKFNNSLGVPADSPLQGQAFFYLGNNFEKFEQEFSQFGICMECCHA